MVDDRLLERKMTEIEQARAWSLRVMSKFEMLIRSGDDRALYRVNPLAFAREAVFLWGTRRRAGDSSLRSGQDG
ncbi:hypothetical protein EN816_19640 [Mesorhizobium sp. M8A.F.Ca.ET.173.01.1.1]|nr:hypothetical protein EN816_19640 [Mesorhizobium sp. M8A.F.Ca.ET.173.01.1.1]